MGAEKPQGFPGSDQTDIFYLQQNIYGDFRTGGLRHRLVEASTSPANGPTPLMALSLSTPSVSAVTTRNTPGSTTTP